MKRALMKRDALAGDVKELQDAEKSRVGSILPRKDIRRNQNPRTHQRGVVLQMAINAIIPTPEPDRVVEVTAEQCNVTVVAVCQFECDVENQVIEEILLTSRIEVIQFNRHKYKRKDCEREFTAKDEECPQKGRFGVNLLV